MTPQVGLVPRTYVFVLGQVACSRGRSGDHWVVEFPMWTKRADERVAVGSPILHVAPDQEAAAALFVVEQVMEKLPGHR